MVTLGQNEFQSGYLLVSMRTAHTRDAGALISIEACVGRMTDSRGTTIVVRPEEGGHGDDAITFVVDARTCAPVGYAEEVGLLDLVQ